MPLFGPSLRERELEETRALYAWVKWHHDRFFQTKLTIGERVYDYFDAVPEAVRDPLAHAMFDLISGERYIWELPEPAFERMDAREFVEYRNLLNTKRHFLLNQERMLQLLHETLVRVLYGMARELPSTDSTTPFTIPLIYALPDPRVMVEKTYTTLCGKPLVDAGMFIDVSNQLVRNFSRVSGIDPLDPKPKKPIIHATESKLPLSDLVTQYLEHTPFYDLFTAPVPLKLTHEDRFNHMHIVGGTGAGKTTLIEHLILHDLKSDDPPSMVIIDPHGDLIQRLLHADLGIEDRLIYINPRDTKFPPALNIFAVNQERMGQYDDVTREQVTAGVIQTFDYLFSGLFSAELTGKQSVFFRYVARLMLSLPEAMGRNATIIDMLSLMADATPYLDAIRKLPPLQREFFERDFNSATFKQTKEQIRYRLQSIIESPTLERLFTSPGTKVDLFTELNSGSIILVDTAKDFLKQGSSTFGRIFISLTLQAILERAAIAEHRRKDTFLIVDEAASYFDSNIDDLLTEVRKFRCGCVFSHQYLDQASASLRASLAANTGIKFASGLSAHDARAMAPEMRTTPDFILDQPKLQFAAHFRHVTPQAISIPIPMRARLPLLSSASFEQVVVRNRARVSFGPASGSLSTEPISAIAATSGPRLETNNQRLHRLIEKDERPW